MKIDAWDIKGDYSRIEDATCETCNCFVAFHPEDSRRSRCYIGSCCAHPPQAMGTVDMFDFPAMFEGQCCAEWTKKIG